MYDIDKVSKQFYLHKFIEYLYTLMIQNGNLDSAEMLRIIEALYELLGVEKQKGENSPAQRVKYIMAKLDENQNGSLNEQEFIQGCLSKYF